MLVQFRSGFRFDQYEEHPIGLNTESGQKEIAKTQSELGYKSHPPFGLLNKNRGGKKFDKYLKERFTSLGSDGGLRKFQKATNSLRRNQIDESDEIESSQQDVCRVQRKNENVQSMPRADSKFFNDIGDVDSTLDKEIQKLVYMSVLRKYKQALDGVFTDNIDNVVDADTNANNMELRINELIRKSKNNVSHESEDNEDGELNEDMRR